MAMTALNDKLYQEELKKLLDFDYDYKRHAADAFAMAVHPRMVVDSVNLPVHAHSIVGVDPGHTHQYSQLPTTATPERWSNGNLYHMLAARMGWGTTQGQCPFKQVICMRVTEERVAILIQSKDDAVLIDDGAFLFPSDALITQLRLL